MRLGFPVRVLGRRGLRAYDTRRPANAPHLSISLAHLRDVFAYLQTTRIHFYRLSSELAPYLSHPGLPQFHHQIEECLTELAAVGALARQQELRLTIHAPLHIQLAAQSTAVLERSITELEQLTALLDAMQLDQEAVIVAHVGGGSQRLDGAPDAVVGRWLSGWERLGTVHSRH